MAASSEANKSAAPTQQRKRNRIAFMKICSSLNLLFTACAGDYAVENGNLSYFNLTSTIQTQKACASA
jgi:hypothetical protein